MLKKLQSKECSLNLLRSAIFWLQEEVLTKVELHVCRQFQVTWLLGGGVIFAAIGK